MSTLSQKYCRKRAKLKSTITDSDMATEQEVTEYLYALYRKLPEPLRQSVVDFMHSLPGRAIEHRQETIDFIKGLFRDKVGIDLDKEQEYSEEEEKMPPAKKSAKLKSTDSDVGTEPEVMWVQNQK